MRVIRLVQDVRGAWFVRTTSGGDKVHSNESYSSPSVAATAFISEGMHQPYASMYVHQPGKAQPVRVRKGRPVPKGDPFVLADRVAVLAAMKPAT